MRVAEYSGLTGRKGTALRSVTSVLWFCVVSQTAGRHLVSEPGGHRGWTPPDKQAAGPGAGRTQARAQGQPAGVGSGAWPG